jgi:hypothetical protein
MAQSLQRLVRFRVTPISGRQYEAPLGHREVLCAEAVSLGMLSRTVRKQDFNRAGRSWRVPSHFRYYGNSSGLYRQRSNRHSAGHAPGDLQEVGLNVDDLVLAVPFCREEVLQAIRLEQDGAVDEAVLVGARSVTKSMHLNWDCPIIMFEAAGAIYIT